MTDAATSSKGPEIPGTPAVPSTTSSTDRGGARWARFWSTGQLIVALAITIAALIYLIVTPAGQSNEQDRRQPKVEVVQTIGDGRIHIQSDSALQRKLQVFTISATSIDSPVLFVSGTVAASLRPGQSTGSDYWQFNAPEILTAYTDWQKSSADIVFAESQLVRTKELAETRISAQIKVVDRIKKLVDAGTDTPKDLAVEQTNLLQYQLEGQKAIYEAETAVRLAKRNEAALARQLQQGGLEPEMLRSATSDVDIVMADVPEGALSIVKIGQGCEAKFFGLPAETFSGKVNGIAPVLSKERRSLRVLFEIHDPKDQLRPGMFAEIGLGTDTRAAILIPAEGVIHVGKRDYVLVGTTERDTWRVTEVQVGEPNEGRIEILSGLKVGDLVMGDGAILLKPAVIKSMQPAQVRSGTATAGRDK